MAYELYAPDLLSPADVRKHGNWKGCSALWVPGAAADRPGMPSPLVSRDHHSLLVLGKVSDRMLEALWLSRAALHNRESDGVTSTFWASSHANSHVADLG